MTDNVAKIFTIVENEDLETLRKEAFNETDKSKQALLMAAYEYQLGKRQREVINRKEFIV